jgi:hypothetical protein
MDIQDGWYRSRVVRCGVDKIKLKSPPKTVQYAFVFFEILDFPHQGKVFEWRGSITPGARPRTMRVLSTCGAEMIDGDPSDLEGIGQHDVQIELKAIDSPEAPGIIQVFVTDVKSLT